MKKKTTRKMQLTRETLVRLEGWSAGGRVEGEIEASCSYCVPNCMSPESLEFAVCEVTLCIKPQ